MGRLIHTVEKAVGLTFNANGYVYAWLGISHAQPIVDTWSAYTAMSCALYE